MTTVNDAGWTSRAGAPGDPAAEVVELLGRLIRADTSNPPGDVRPALAVLEDYFAGNGLPVTLVGESPEFGNLVARLPGSGGGRSLLLLGHADVVPADEDDWSEPAFSGAVRDGYVWGRGALDMKNQVAAQAVAIVRLARAAAAGTRLRGDVVFAATADEETGVRCGARWLFAHHPELARADFVINEGGCVLRRPGAAPLFLVHCGEKGYANTVVRVSGRGGHGSMPRHDDNAVTGLAEVLSALAAYEPEVTAERIPAELIDLAVDDPGLRARLKDPATAQRAVRELARGDAALAGVIEPLLGLTLACTVVHTVGRAVNVIPAAAEIHIDCRVLPGQTADDVYREIGRALAGVGARWHIVSCDVVSGSLSDASGLLFEAVAASLAESVPGAVVVPGLFAAFTDSTHVRSAYPGVPAYGICPFVEEDFRALAPRVHSVDERVAVADLALQADFFERVAARVAG